MYFVYYCAHAHAEVVHNRVITITYDDDDQRIGDDALSITMYKCLNNLAPHYLMSSFIKRLDIQKHNSHNRDNLQFSTVKNCSCTEILYLQRMQIVKRTAHRNQKYQTKLQIQKSRKSNVLVNG